MMDYARLYTDLRRDEGWQRWPYDDPVGVKSVGAGHNLAVSPLPAGWYYPLTDIQIDSLLRADVTHLVTQLTLRAPWWAELDPVRQRAVANLAYNVGVSGMLGFKRAVKAMQEKRWYNAAFELLDSKWHVQVGRRAERIARMVQTGLEPGAKEEPIYADDFLRE